MTLAVEIFKQSQVVCTANHYHRGVRCSDVAAKTVIPDVECSANHVFQFLKIG